MCRVAVLVILFFSSATGVLRAQSTNASITGRVTDPSKAVIANAKVAAINAGRNVRYEGATTEFLRVRTGQVVGDLAPAPQVWRAL